MDRLNHLLHGLRRGRVRRGRDQARRFTAQTCHVDGLEAAQHGIDLGGRARHRRHAVLQRGEQPRQQRDHAAPLFGRLLRRHAPQQIIGGLPAALPQLVDAARSGIRQDALPHDVQKIAHRSQRHEANKQQGHHHKRLLRRRRGGGVPKLFADGFSGVVIILGGEEGGELREQLGEYARGGLIVRKHVRDHLLHFFKTPLLSGRILFVPTEAGMAQGVQQPPRRVVFVSEKFLVDDRNFEDGKQQKKEQTLDEFGNARLIKDEFEDHADDIDCIVVYRIDYFTSSRVDQQLQNFCFFFYFFFL